jgi:hypothetical protein
MHRGKGPRGAREITAPVSVGRVSRNGLLGPPSYRTSSTRARAMLSPPNARAGTVPSVGLHSMTLGCRKRQDAELAPAESGMLGARPPLSGRHDRSEAPSSGTPALLTCESADQASRWSPSGTTSARREGGCSCTAIAVRKWSCAIATLASRLTKPPVLGRGGLVGKSGPSAVAVG